MNASTEARARMLAGLLASHRRLDVAGISTSVIEAGEGPPLVLLHGGIECGGVYWAPVIARLADRHHVVVPDAPGLGESEPVDRLDVDRFAGWLEDLLALTDAAQPMLVSHSLLGTLAARYAARHADMLNQLVIYGAPGIGPYRMPAGLVYAAIRFSVRQSARNAERFERFALLDLETTRKRDPAWFEAFDVVLALVRLGPAHQRDDAAPDRRRDQADPRRRTEANQHADQPGLGASGPHGSAEAR